MRSTRVTAKVQIQGYTFGLLQRMEIREQYDKHAVAMVDFPYPSSLRMIPPEGTPAVLQWGYAPAQTRQWHGYVNHTEEHVASSRYQDSGLRVTLVGTSLPFNNPTPSSWSKVSPSFIVRQVAERHRLRAVVHPSKEVLDYWAQGVETDWAMLKRLADRVGYRYWVDGSTLYFLDPERLLRRAATTQVSNLRMYRKPGDNLISLSVLSGSLVPRDTPAAIRDVYGMDKTSGHIFKVTSSKAVSDRGITAPTRREIYPLAVKDAAEARRVTEAQTAKGRWVTAEAHTIAETVMRVGDVVNVLGNAVHPNQQGLWLIDGCTHVVERDRKDAPVRVFNDLMISRNQEKTSYFRTTTPLTAAPRIVPVRLRNGAWESELLESVYV